MGVTPRTIDDYAAALEPGVAAIFASVRGVIRTAAPEVVETISYQMPCFSLDGQAIVYVGAWKQHLGIYPIPRFDAGLETRVAPYRTGRDSLRFDYAEPLPVGLISDILAALLALRRGP